MKCNLDCFNCPYPDCINDVVDPLKRKLKEGERAEKNRQYAREYRAKHRQKYVEYSKRYYQEHKEEQKELSRNRMRARRSQRKGDTEVFNFGEWLKAYRKEHGVTQVQLEQTLIMTADNLSAYENNRRVPNLHTLNWILDCLGYEIKVVKKP